MNNVKHEQGYALVTVLVIVTVFTVLFLAFMGQAFNSVKQNQAVEKTSQSVALAEMGVSYYDVAIQDIFEKMKSEIKVKVESKELTTESAVIDYMKSSFKSSIKNITPPSTIDENASFTIEKSDDKINVTPAQNQLKIEITVVGTKKEDSTKLEVEMVINNLSDIHIVSTTANSAPEIIFGKVSKPDIIDVNCNNPQSLDVSKGNGNKGTGKNGNSDLNVICSDVYIDQPVIGTRTYTGNNNVDVSKIYSTISLDFPGNLNNIGSLQIYAKSLQMGSNFNNPTSVTVETKENFSIGSNVQNTNHVNFYVGGLLNINGQLDLNFNSNVFIRGTRTVEEIADKTISTVSKNLNIDSTSTMCVNGNLKVEGGLVIQTQDHLIIKGKVLDSFGTQINDSKIKYVTESTNTEWLQQQCLNTFEIPSTSNSIEWGSLTNSMVNDVTYP
jgi:competence protein ComGC